MSQKRKIDELQGQKSEEPPLKVRKIDADHTLLNSDILGEITRYLDINDAIRLGNGSKVLYTLIWKVLRVIDVEVNVDQVPNFLRTINAAGSVEKFSIKIKHGKQQLKYNQECSYQLATYLGSCANLTDLTLNRSYFGDVDILSSLTNLKSVHIVEYDNTPLDQLFPNHSKLISLTLSNWALHKLSGLSAIHNVTSLSLVDSMIDCEGEDIDPLPDIYSTLTNLRELKLNEFDLFDLRGISKLKNLTNLDLTEVRLNEDEEYDFRPLLKLPKLQTVCLVGVEGLTGSHHQTLAKLNLTSLVLPDEEPISDDEEDNEENEDNEDKSENDEENSDD